MERGLHALLVIAGRHICGWSKPTELDEDDPDFAQFLRFLKRRAKRIDPEHLHVLETLIDRRLSEWKKRGPDRWGDIRGDRDEEMLMVVSGTKTEEDVSLLWEVPTSLRNVDVQCGAKVIQFYD